LAGYVALGSIVFFIQRKMLYFPNVSPLSEERASEAGLRHWPSHKNFRGFTGIGETADARGTIIVFHGNAGAAWDRSFYVKALSRQNFRVVLAEYPGYGGRSGHPGEDVMVEDALETIRLAHQEHGGPVFLWGESLGCGVVAHAVRLSDIPIKGVVLFLPWDSLPDLAQAHYWFLPARWLVLDKFNNVENLEKYEGKIAVILAENDEVIPVRHGQRLFESILTGKKLWLFEGASHNEMPIAADQPWWGEVTGFVSR
jgi:pimeloyl-ACP methyl ester carboxylesterase